MSHAVQQWQHEGRRIAIATVVNTWGSAPRPVGAIMLISDDLRIAGSVSGGCVENAVIEEAQQCLRNGTPRLLHYGVSDDTAWEAGLACGGSIRVFVEPLDSAWWQVWHAQPEQRRVCVTVLEGDQAGYKAIFDAQGSVLYATPTLHATLLARWQQALPGWQQPQPVEHDGLSLLVTVQQPRPHLIIVGGVHVALPLSTFAQELDFRVSVVDPRKVFASEERFPAVDSLLHRYPPEAFDVLGLDAHSYVAVLTHDPKIDDPALLHALPSPAPYVGVLSSRRTHEKRIARLRAAGLAEELIERIQTPIGLDIGASTPAEIALSIMAQIVAQRRRSTAAIKQT